MSQKLGNQTWSVHIQQNSLKDLGGGTIKFSNGLTITDDTPQRNGTRYDIKSMDISEYKGQLTANHSSRIEEVIGQVTGVRKIANRRVVVDGIKFAVEENALAQYAYNMVKAGYLNDFSIETYGPWPDEEGVYHDSKLVGLSVVVVGNNRSAAINKVALESVKEAREAGLDTSIVENNFICYDYTDEDQEQTNNKAKDKETDMSFVTIKNHKKFAVRVSYKNAAGDDVETELDPGATIDVSEDQKEDVESQIKDSTDPRPAPTPQPETGTTEESLTKALNAALKPMADKMAELEQKMFDNGVEEPTFSKPSNGKAGGKVSSELAKMDWKERYNTQIIHAWNWLKSGNAGAQRSLESINEYHLEELKKKGMVSNAVSLGDFGNFVMPDEMVSEIQGTRSNYEPFLSRLDWRETLALQMAWLSRSGDIDMTSVEMCDDGANGNLKPISDYSATIETSSLEELAAVTPVCNAATRFLAVDLLGDVAMGYRTDYDRKRAQLAIARLEQAVESNGNGVTYGTTSDGAALQAFINTWSEAAQEIVNGIFVFSAQTYGELVRRLVGAGINGSLGNVFTTGDQPMILGRPYVIVPNDLLPALNTAETKSFTVDGATVTVNHAVFYFDPTTFTGRTSGGLQYDLSSDAAYEENGTVKSAYQRNELVVRGSFFRGGAIKNEDQVVGLRSPGVS